MIIITVGAVVSLKWPQTTDGALKLVCTYESFLGRSKTYHAFSPRLKHETTAAGDGERYYHRSLSMYWWRSVYLWLGVWTPWLATPLPKLKFQRPKIHAFSFGGRELNWLTQVCLGNDHQTTSVFTSNVVISNSQMPTFVPQRSAERNAGLLLATEFSYYRLSWTRLRNGAYITVSTVVLNCCKGDRPSQWETPIFGPL